MQSGEISFFRKVSSESSYDHLRFYVDEMMLGEWSGDQDWELATAAIPEGEHILKWVYVKDGSVANGEDCAWIDDITFPATATIMDVQRHILNNEISVYPNPGTGEFWVSMPADQQVKALLVLDINGKQLLRESNFKTSNPIDLTALKAGVYLLRLETQDGVYTQKVLIK